MNTDRGILIVDDEKQVRELIYNYVTALGFTSVDMVSDGEAADRLLRNINYNYSVIILDLQMPKLDGSHVAMTAKIKGSYVIGITGNHNEEFAGKVDLLLEKPFRMKELALALAQIN